MTTTTTTTFIVNNFPPDLPRGFGALNTVLWLHSLPGTSFSLALLVLNGDYVNIISI